MGHGMCDLAGIEVNLDLEIMLKVSVYDQIHCVSLYFGSIKNKSGEDFVNYKILDVITL